MSTAASTEAALRSRRRFLHMPHGPGHPSLGLRGDLANSNQYQSGQEEPTLAPLKVLELCHYQWPLMFLSPLCLTGSAYHSFFSFSGKGSSNNDLSICIFIFTSWGRAYCQRTVTGKKWCLEKRFRTISKAPSFRHYVEKRGKKRNLP